MYQLRYWKELYQIRVHLNYLAIKGAEALCRKRVDRRGLGPAVQPAPRCDVLAIALHYRVGGGKGAMLVFYRLALQRIEEGTKIPDLVDRESIQPADHA
jgi:hypothetical protein